MSLPDKYRYVAVEGPIGVGKTSLARRLAQHMGASLLLEKPDANPFLAKFYENPARHALATQLFFLFQRGDEVRELAQMDMFHTATVADYLFDKDSLFARLNLGEQEFALYQQIYLSLQLQAPPPDLVIYLQAEPQVLIERVQTRATSYEQNIPADYLQRLSQSYSDFFYHYTAAPVLTVNSERLDFVNSDDDFGLLLQRIEQMRGPREFFNRGG
jgi:deoxyadenosine/deoxycytidine kinase